jgi:hypothetical protein
MKQKTKNKPRKKKFRMFGPQAIGAKARRLRRLKAQSGESNPEVVEERFADENTVLAPDSAPPVSAREDDVREELSHLEGYRDYLEEARGNTLTYGDY